MAYNPEIQRILAFTIGMTGGVDEAIDAIQNQELNRSIYSTELPKDMSPNREVYEALGFQFEEMGDEVLYRAKLPEGWSLKRVGEYHTDIFDQKGRRRGSYFYKGVFYDRNGHMNLFCRYIISSRHTIEKNYNSPIIVYVRDMADNSCVREFGTAPNDWSKEFELEREKACQYLNENFPHWENVQSYWD